MLSNVTKLFFLADIKNKCLLKATFFIVANSNRRLQDKDTVNIDT